MQAMRQGLHILPNFDDIALDLFDMILRDFLGNGETQFQAGQSDCYESCLLVGPDKTPAF